MKFNKVLNLKNVIRVLFIMILLVIIFVLIIWYRFHPETSNTIQPMLNFIAKASIDQDDICIWIHPTDALKSFIITADKKAEKIFVYDLEGNTIQSISMPKPGNIDVRYKFPLGDKEVDIVAYLQRQKGDRVIVFVVDSITCQLKRMDDDSIICNKGNGGTLYHNKKTDKFYFIKTSENRDTGDIEQFELYDNNKGKITGRKVRHWNLAGCEGAVADDETGLLYIAQEDVGIWRVGAEPDDSIPGELIIKTGTNGLVSDIEGLCICKISSKEGYLLVSNQTRNSFKIFQISEENKFIGTFSIDGAIHTDGIDMTNLSLGNRFPKGIFVCHTDQEDSDQCPVLVTSWESIAKSLNLKANVFWNPRTCNADYYK